MTIRTFVSYAHQDKELAAEIKGGLAKYGFGCFLAHEDITPSATWQKRIFQELQSCQVFLAVLTEHFDESDWTHQEIGIAYARHEQIVLLPIRVSARARGFFKNFQEVPLDSDVPEACYQIAMAVTSESEGLARHIHIQAALLDLLEEANTYDEAGAVARRIGERDAVIPLAPEEVKKLLRIAASNNQVYESRRASQPLRKLLQRYKHSASKRLLGNFYKVWLYR